MPINKPIPFHWKDESSIDKLEKQTERILRIFDTAKENAIDYFKSPMAYSYTDAARFNYITKLENTSAIVNPVRSNYLALTHQPRNGKVIVEFRKGVFDKSDEDIYEISLHELAHVLAFQHGHNTVWRAMYKNIGGSRVARSYFIPSGKTYKYKFPVGLNSKGGFRYKYLILDQKYKNAHPEYDKYIIQENPT